MVDNSSGLPKDRQEKAAQGQAAKPSPPPASSAKPPPLPIPPADSLPPVKLPLLVEVDHSATLNLAMAHNAVPLVSAVRLTNRVDRRLEDILVVLQLQPGMSEPWEARIHSLDREETYNLSKVDLQLDLPRLVGIAERESAQVEVKVRVGGQPVLRRLHKVDLLAYNEWNGMAALPQLLAAFVQPNHPAIAEVLVQVRQVLEKQTGDPSLAGYQDRDPSRVRDMVQALYTALQQMGMSYINPPASFEEQGQKIRTPDQMVKLKMGTCLDLTVLVAACLEQMGLHPWLVLVKGHAFPGVWLEEEDASWTWTDSALQLLKVVELNGVLLFDATTMVDRPHVPLARAERAAQELLKKEDRFACAICVKSARAEFIRPLPARVKAGSYQVVPEPVQDTVAMAGKAPAPPARDPEQAPSQEKQVAPPPIPKEASPAIAGRLVRWKEKLLDLSLRNRLLNFRETKKSIQILCPDLAQMEDSLALGRSFQIKPRPEMLGAADPRDKGMLDAQAGDDALQSYLAEQLERNVLFSSLAPKELDRRQKEISSAARISLEESGVSTLYLAVGFLSWYEGVKTEQQRLAPLLLLPVEFTRRTVRDPFELARIDEEPQINVTLLEKLRKDHGVEIPELADEVPQDEAGVDVPLVLRLFREAVLNIKRWHVEEMVCLGHFSFTKFLMWRDLETGADKLMNSPVVKHLACDTERTYPDQGPFPEPDELDKKRHTRNTLCPLDADSSQLAAVFAAEDGLSFILEGPPGTGKSQTITNLISQSLAAGKTVLFVSEKMAALDVVHRRLESVGLGEFCLELHSNKARKKEVLARLGRSWEAMSTQVPGDWEIRTAELDSLRRQLNSYVEALHLPRQGGESYFEVISRLMTLRRAPRVRINPADPAQMSQQHLTQLREIVARMSTAAAPVGNPGAHPFCAIQLIEWMPSNQDRVLELTACLNELARELAARAQACTKVMRADAYPLSASELVEQGKMASLILNSPGPPDGLLEQHGWSGVRAEVEGWIAHGQKRDELRGALAKRYDTEALRRFEIRPLQQKFARWATAFFLLAFFMLFFARRRVRTALKPDQRLPSNQELDQDLRRTLSLMGEEEVLLGVDHEARQRLGGHWSPAGGTDNWPALRDLLAWVTSFRQALGSILARMEMSDAEREGQRSRLLLLASEESLVRIPGSQARAALEEYRTALDAYLALREKLSEALQLDETRAWGGLDDPAHLDRVMNWARGCLAEPKKLRDWCYYVRTCKEAEGAGLAPLVQAHQEEDLPTAELQNTFERAYGEWWMEKVGLSDPVLRSFHSAEQQRCIHTFRQRDGAFSDLVQQAVRARLATRLPDPRGNTTASSEMGILRRELQKKTRHMPVRKLFARIPTLLRRLKPCLLMSPLSVAQYLGTDYSVFDLVVFDEASQIPTHDAIGCLGRGKAAVVVGDTTQLPPTTFFARLGDNDENLDEGDVAELESILDECVASGLPQRRLGWHYRSKHESLIAFSNYHYYENGLHTFPSAESKRGRLGVSLKPVPEGHYDKGRSRTNKAEASKVVTEIVRRLEDPQLRKRSIGVVTFSMAQQRLIEELLDEERRSRPQIEPYFSDTVKEPVFIKNLENVQGDERDVMLFSVCYGPDLAGSVSMNFGPLNRNGGERRLNVAVTRARYQLMVFSTLTPDQIDLSRTRSEGARHLKTFLDYARRGPAAIAEAITVGAAGDFDSPFERLVCEGLRARGWEVHPQVGCSGYRIDLGVVDSKDPGRYVLGVECDGASYHSSRCARDRDRLRELVLNGLGWQLHRIWSTDFWHDPQRELDKVEAALKEALARRQDRPLNGAWSDLSFDAGVDGSSPHEPATGAVISSLPKTKSPPREPLFASGPDALKASPASLLTIPEEPPGEPYPEIAPHPLLGSKESFYNNGKDWRIKDRIVAVVAQEAPIHQQLLARRVLVCFDLKRLTQKSVGRIMRLARSARVKVRGDFVWKWDQDPEQYESFRRQGDEPNQQRKAQEIPPEEAASAVLHMLRQNIALPMDELVSGTSRLLGFNRLGHQVQSSMEQGVLLLIRRGKCKRDGERVEICE